MLPFVLFSAAYVWIVLDLACLQPTTSKPPFVTPPSPFGPIFQGMVLAQEWMVACLWQMQLGCKFGWKQVKRNNDVMTFEEIMIWSCYWGLQKDRPGKRYKQWHREFYTLQAQLILIFCHQEKNQYWHPSEGKDISSHYDCAYGAHFFRAVKKIADMEPAWVWALYTDAHGIRQEICCACPICRNSLAFCAHLICAFL
jgi:hypothetical protein